MEYSSTSHPQASDNSRPRSPSNANLIEVVPSSLNQSKSSSSYDDYGHYNESSYMGDSSFGDETQYHPSKHSHNEHVSRYEYHRSGNVHGSTAERRSGHDKYEHHYQHSYVQRNLGDRHHDKSGSSEPL